MQKISFMDDYSEGCHPRILASLTESNFQQQSAYGEDQYTQEAIRLLRQRVENPQCAVHLVASGTMANLVIIAACLRPHQAVIAASSGHINGREAGAIEATGHKVITVPSADGRIDSAGIEAVLSAHAHAPHMVSPKLVYLSNATECGTVYSVAQLQAIRQTCDAHGLYLMIDGARLGAALAAEAQLDLKQIAALCDVFWLGGTKLGALIGEAILIPNPALAEDFAHIVKQRGAMLAKSRLLGVQFCELLGDDLYLELAAHANKMALRLTDAVVNAGYTLAVATESNQVFPVLPNSLIDTLDTNFLFHRWQTIDVHNSVIRLVCSWASTGSDVDQWVAALSNPLKN